MKERNRRPQQPENTDIHKRAFSSKKAGIITGELKIEWEHLFELFLGDLDEIKENYEEGVDIYNYLKVHVAWEVNKIETTGCLFSLLINFRMEYNN